MAVSRTETGFPETFLDPRAWKAFASGEARLRIGGETGLRLDFDFKGGGGFVVARREGMLRLPGLFSCSFRVRGTAPRNKLEFKIVGPGGADVWRWQQESFPFSRRGTRVTLRERDLPFAWGPAGGGIPDRTEAFEFAISAGPGGKGSIRIEDFRFEDLTLHEEPLVTVSSLAKGTRPPSLESIARKQSHKQRWQAAPEDGNPWIAVDFQGQREFGGLVLDWAQDGARPFTLQACSNGDSWRTLATQRDTPLARTHLFLPDSRANRLRIRFRGNPTLRSLRLLEPGEARTLGDFLHTVAAMAPRGHHPRYLLREQSYWTSAGSPDGTSCQLLNEEGMAEPIAGECSIAPFLRIGDRFFSWANTRNSTQLAEGSVAIPSAAWRLPGLTMEVTAFATGGAAAVRRFLRYRIRNLGTKTLRARLFLTICPHQVTPPWQSWNGMGGIAPVHNIRWHNGAVETDRDWRVIPLRRPTGFGAAAAAEGMMADVLAAGKTPDRKSARDPHGLASGALWFDLTIASGAEGEVALVVPEKGAKAPAKVRVDEAYAEAFTEMRARSARVEFRLPRGDARDAAAVFHSAAGQILVQRDGAALQPGPRRYTRSWIRDGVIMGAALQRAGDFAALARFLDWYAPHIRADGHVPCCVDRSGADPLVEHDSHGQFLYGVRESFRFTGDLSKLRSFWPKIRKVARHIIALRAERLTPAYAKGPLADRRGLLPESASHEGYLAHPVHSYWDDFWAWRGLRDAAESAAILNHPQEAASFAKEAKDLGRCIERSMRRVIRLRRIPHVPGSVEWADFDPTATANAISLLDALPLLPPQPLEGMFDTFLRDFRLKHADLMPWTQTTAYEIRIIGALVRMGRREDALSMLGHYLRDRRPRGWNQWPEISWRDPRSPGHLGDVPHTWIAAEFMLAFASMFAFECAQRDALVVGAGIDRGWIGTSRGLSVRGLPTHYGLLDLAIRSDPRCGGLRVTIGGSLRMPGGGIVLRLPPKVSSRIATARKGYPPAEKEMIVRALPAEIFVRD
jgi:hypothetical protein